MSFTIRFAGEVWAHELSPVGGIKYSWNMRGPLAASWSMALPKGFLHPALVQGTTVEIFYCGATRVWRGVLEEPNRDEWKVTAVGFASYFANVVCLYNDEDGHGEVGISLGGLYDDASRNAIERGFDFELDEITPSWPEGFDPENLMIDPQDDSVLTLKGILDALSQTSGLRWVVDEHGLLTFIHEPEEPVFALTPDVPGLGLSTDNYYSATYVRYRAGTYPDGTPIIRTVASYSEDADRWGPRERAFVLDLDHVNNWSQTIADALQKEAVASPVRGVRLQYGQLTNPGGTPIALPLLRTAEKAHHYGVLEEPGARDVHTWTIGHFEVDTADGTVTVSPQHVAPRTLAQVIQDVYEPGTERPISTFYELESSGDD